MPAPSWRCFGPARVLAVRALARGSGCVHLVVEAAAARQCDGRVPMACSGGAVLKARLHLTVRAAGRRQHSSAARGGSSMQRQGSGCGRALQQRTRGIKEGG
jgi:hypothetical protein